MRRYRVCTLESAQSKVIKVVLARNYATFASQYGSSCDGGVLNALRQLIAGQLAMDPEEISPDTRIPHDLNIY